MVFLNYKKSEQADYISALEDILKVGGAGVLIFDERDALKHSNSVANETFQALDAERDFANLQDFIAYIFDHASEDAFSTPDYFNAIEVAGQAADFREVIIGDDGRSYLVEMYKVQKGGTVVLIRNVSVLRTQNDNLFALNQLNEELSLAIEAASCGVFILDAKTSDLNVQFMNHICRTDTDLAAIPDDGLAFDRLLLGLGSSEDFKTILEFAGARDAMQKQVKFEKEGDTRWFDVRLNPVFDHNDEIDLYIGVLSDITSLKKREAEFFRSQKLDSLGQLSAGIAHDFNNILSIVEGYTRMIEMNLDKPDRVLEFTAKMQETSARGAGLTNKMMAFARHKNVQGSVSHISEIVEEQDVLLRQLLDANIVFNVTISDDNLYAECEGDDFVQIMMNLVVNARDAVMDGGTVDVTLEGLCGDLLPDFITARDADYVCLYVRDNGMGMSEAVVEKMFDPFFTTKDQGKGTGLGLSVVYGLVNDMGGYIDVRSEISVGSEFVVYIPRVEAPKGEAARKVKRIARGDAQEIDFTGYTALVVEDEPDLRAILVSLLKRHNMDVIEADNGNDALIAQDDYGGQIDMLITDIVMPGMGGFKLSEMMSALHPDIHVIYISGYPARGDGAIVAMPDDAVFIPKPIDFEVLYASMQTALHGAPQDFTDVNSNQIGELQ